MLVWLDFQEKRMFLTNLPKAAASCSEVWDGGEKLRDSEAARICGKAGQMFTVLIQPGYSRNF